MISTLSLKFLEELRKNNHREWFLTHKKEYEASKKEFTDFVNELIVKHGSRDASIAHLQAKDCLFRINRDVRFSKDKSPYKTNFGASISAGGKKGGLAGYYFHLEPGGSFVGGGLYMPEAPQLAKVRQEIDYSWEEFLEIFKKENFKRIYGDLDRSDEFRLIRMPKGYENDHPAAEYLKLKSFVAIKQLSDEEVLNANLPDQILEAFTALQPLNELINRGLD